MSNNNIAAKRAKEKKRTERRVQAAVAADPLLAAVLECRNARGPVAELFLAAAARREAQIRKEATA